MRNGVQLYNKAIKLNMMRLPVMLSACSYVYVDKFTALCSKCPPPERTHQMRQCLLNVCHRRIH